MDVYALTTEYKLNIKLKNKVYILSVVLVFYFQMCLLGNVNRTIAIITIIIKINANQARMLSVGPPVDGAVVAVMGSEGGRELRHCCSVCLVKGTLHGAATTNWLV